MVLITRDPEVISAQSCSPEADCTEEAMRGVLSAWDGLLEAEFELGVNPGSVGIATLFASAVQGAENPSEVCYGLRAPEGCAQTNTLRSFWTAASRVPGWDRPMPAVGEIRRGLANGTYVPHSNLTAGLLDRWVHTFSADAGAEPVLKDPTPARECEVWTRGEGRDGSGGDGCRGDGRKGRRRDGEVWADPAHAVAYAAPRGCGRVSRPCASTTTSRTRRRRRPRLRSRSSSSRRDTGLSRAAPSRQEWTVCAGAPPVGPEKNRASRAGFRWQARGSSCGLAEPPGSPA